MRRLSWNLSQAAGLGGPLSTPLVTPSGPTGPPPTLRSVWCLTSDAETSLLTLFLFRSQFLRFLGLHHKGGSINVFPIMGLAGPSGGTQTVRREELIFQGGQEGPHCGSPARDHQWVDGGQNYLSFHPVQQLNIFPSKRHRSLPKRNSFFVSLGMKQTREECGRWSRCGRTLSLPAYRNAQ